MKVAYPININNMSQGLGFRSVKVQTEDFLKKDSQHFKNSFQAVWSFYGLTVNPILDMVYSIKPCKIRTIRNPQFNGISLCVKIKKTKKRKSSQNNCDQYYLERIFGAKFTMPETKL
jgi:hypothetical protein